MRIGLLALAMTATAGAAAAEATLSIPLELGTSGNVQSETYSCGDGDPFPVQFVNSGANALAIMEIDGEERIFVNVVSGSGARYASGPYIWWTKGNTATLENEMEQDSLVECRMDDASSPE